ncbi:MAG: hypothetical protein GY816_03275 [Cytophagales bacterium]|nr:hypothetical protein [Cytophagales bacterium]
MRKVNTLFIFLNFISIQTFGQSRWNLAVTGGLAGNINSFTDGFGVNLGAGIQKPIWRDKIRIHPSINYGRFWGGFGAHIPETGFNSTSLRFDVESDLLRVGSLSLLLGTGLMLNNTFGWVETDLNSLEPRKSKFSTTTLAFNLFLGGGELLLEKKGKRQLNLYC